MRRWRPREDSAENKFCLLLICVVENDGMSVTWLCECKSFSSCVTIMDLITTKIQVYRIQPKSSYLPILFFLIRFDHSFFIRLNLHITFDNNKAVSVSGMAHRRSWYSTNTMTKVSLLINFLIPSLLIDSIVSS